MSVQGSARGSHLSKRAAWKTRGWRGRNGSRASHRPVSTSAGIVTTESGTRRSGGSPAKCWRAWGRVPVERIERLVSDFASGYATPKVDVRGAVFHEDRILLVREASDGLWALPGGFADVGRSASENVVKEILEEASITVTATRLYALRHKAKHGYPPDARDFYKLLFLCEPVGEVSPRPGPDVMEAGFFGLEELPPLSTSRTIPDDVAAAFASRRESTGPARFD